MMDDHDPLLSRKQADRYTGYSYHSFATWDYRKTYDLKPIKHRGKVYYRRSVLDDFMERKNIKLAKACYTAA